MRFHHLRNATAKLTYSGVTFVIDPSLGAAGSWPEVSWIANPGPNPMVDLPIPIDDVFVGADAILRTHLHFDHLDDAAITRLPNELPVLCQPADHAPLLERGIGGARPVNRAATCGGVDVVRVNAQHGFGRVATLAGPSSGYVLRSAAEPTLYLTGDTVWCDDVSNVIEEFKPDVVVANAGGAQLANGSRVIMDVGDITQLAEAAPSAHIVIVHLEAVSHCLSSRDDHRQAHIKRPALSIPDDGEALKI
jgi:L-ascorbate metabolism protein UlaG (beta-lactamase superfamily)